MRAPPFAFTTPCVTTSNTTSYVILHDMPRVVEVAVALRTSLARLTLLRLLT